MHGDPMSAMITPDDGSAYDFAYGPECPELELCHEGDRCSYDRAWDDDMCYITVTNFSIEFRYVVIRSWPLVGDSVVAAARVRHERRRYAAASRRRLLGDAGAVAMTRSVRARLATE